MNSVNSGCAAMTNTAKKDIDPYSLFLFAINSSQTKENYVTRLNWFFNYLGIHKNTNEEWRKWRTGFVDKSPKWIVIVIFPISKGPDEPYYCSNLNTKTKNIIQEKTKQKQM
jgi:hypothetical protein